MLDTETRRRIDSARDILVGKVPDPKSQVEQITIALIYKFMDDMDAKAEELGGERQFFEGEFAQYGWAGLMHSGQSGHEVLDLYATAIARMPENPGIPSLFRNIFNNAYLPYRDPETLRAFLKVIDEFTYDHSERLGDAFEYLLSVLGSQGDAGQFRTPRHIIDFIVEIIDPRKHETVLDPACGTAGFLISSWKHIDKANTDANGNSTLSSDEKLKLTQNFNGYDISPDMVRLSLVNMYLHDFKQPRIHEYDTLTSEDRWNEFADVILANPPFMSPKGGIRPHSRFSVKSKRSEVLFVDYIAEHLTPNGRAGVVIPEGIIFQSQNAHRQLRRKLVEDYLVAVISLPAGVFNPYSGVKTSVLILDRKLAKQTDHIAFYKVENDGFDLGAQRRAIEKNDLPMVREELCRYLDMSRAGKTANAPDPEPESTANVAEQGVVYESQPRQSSLGLVVERKKIAADVEYNLGMERYQESSFQYTKFARVKINTLVNTVTPPAKIPRNAYAETGRFPIIDQSQNEIAGWTDDDSTVIMPDKPLVIFGDHTCTVKLIETPFAQGADGIKILNTIDAVDPKYL
ncbi:MAG: N-6 DNA methylase, partial [Gemmatimonadetes bacterium]|nr:N-6 DNA methylase [Gemmatimonadota bacterium]